METNGEVRLQSAEVVNMLTASDDMN
jgi:hypothetical protein